MRSLRSLAVAVALGLTVPAGSAVAQDGDRSVAGGGIHVAGWMGVIDARAASQGQSVKDAKLTKAGDVLQVMTGPAITYWHPDHRASGDYTVKATFTEPKYMSINDHPHPYGIVIAGNDLGTDRQSYLYCAAYGNGSFILRGFGPEPFQVGRRAPHDAVHKAAGQGQPVTQEIAVSVKGDKVECAINGTVVASHPKAELVTAGKLKSTDGVYGVRFAHNTEGTVSGLTVTKP